MGFGLRWQALLILVIESFYASTVNCQSTGPTDPSTTTEFEIILNQEFQLLWFHWLAIILTLALLVVVLAPSAVYLFYYYKKTPQVRHVEKEVEGKPKYLREETDGINMDILFRNMECDYNEIPRTDILIIDRLGIGEFGPLYDAEVKLAENDMQRAMVKVFQQGTSQDLVRFREEVERLKCLDHPRVARLFGVVSKSPYFIVTELAINGDLKTFLTNSLDKEDEDGNPALDVPKLVAMGADVASGLSYLHCVDYVHKDIAARNCIVTDDLCVKIADFKVGRFLHRSEYAVQADGSLMPLRWMAPESIEENKFTLQSSVWSFGVLLWEVMSKGKYPYSKLSDEEVAKDVCESRVRLPRPPDCPDRVFKVMAECWSREPRQRHQMSLVHRMLESSILTNKYDKSHIRLYS